MKRPLLESDEKRQIGLLLWVLLLINVCIFGVGLLLTRAAELGSDGLWGTLGVAALANGSFAVIVGADIMRVVTQGFCGRRRDGPG